MNINRDSTIQLLDNYNIKEFSNIEFQELPFVKKINLRGDPKNINFISSCKKILSVALPITPNTYTSDKKRKIIWLGPDEWLVTDESQNNSDLINKLHIAVGDQESSVTDVSENRTILRISGKYLFNLLSKFLVLDIDKNLSNESSVAQTLFVKVSVLIVRNQKNNQDPEVDIFANRSHAKYVYNLLVDGSKNLHF